MGWRAIVAALTGTVLLPLTLPAAAGQASSPGAEVVGLWDADFKAEMTAEDCGEWRLNAQGFCSANDARNGVELGVKFQTSRKLLITGVRVYRTDLNTIKGTLWNAEGRSLATGTFAPAATAGWQDLTFAHPVAISPGRTYIASYHSPATKYAFEYGFFEDELVRGPVTALRAVEGDPNGVHCYDNAQWCSFPTNRYRSSTYWVSPLWQNPSDQPVPPPAVPTPPTDVVAPVVKSAQPSNGAKRVGPRRSIKITFSEGVRSRLLTKSSVRLKQKGRKKRVPVRLRYDARRHRLTVDPVGRLRPATTYRIVIATRVVDIAGNRLDQDPGRDGAQRATWRFRTR